MNVPTARCRARCVASGECAPHDGRLATFDRLLINAGDAPVSTSIPLVTLGLGGAQTVGVRDVWAHKRLDDLHSGTWTVQGLTSHDSKLVMLTPLH